MAPQTSQKKETVFGDGPSKWDIILSLFENKKVTFELSDMETLVWLREPKEHTVVDSKEEMIITGIERSFPFSPESELWKIKGFFLNIKKKRKFVTFEGSYSTKFRTGSIEIKSAEIY